MHPGKYYLLISGHKYQHQWVHIGKDMVWEENEVKHLGITIDNELMFDSHILNICSKANKKLSVLCRINSEGYYLSQFLKHSINIALLYECSVVDPPITKPTSFTKEL